MIPPEEGISGFKTRNLGLEYERVAALVDARGRSQGHAAEITEG